MDQMNTVVTLLTIVVVILSVVIVALIATVTLILIKLNKLVSDAKSVTQNLAAATKWLNPVTVFSELMHAIRNR